MKDYALGKRGEGKKREIQAHLPDETEG